MRLPARAIALAVVLSACAAPVDGDDADQASAATGTNLRVVFDETVSHAFMGGDIAWFDASRGAVFSLSGQQYWGETERKWVERRWDPTSATWIETSSALARPGEPSGLVVDEDHAYAIDGSGLLRVDANGEVNAWSSGAWTARGGMAGIGAARKRFSIAYDSDRRRIVLFGGAKTSDTWEWDGKAWAQVATSGPPATAAPGSMIYDPIRRRTVLAMPGAGTWLWDGATWTETAAIAPANESRAHLVWNAHRKVVTFVSGATLSEWNGASWKGLPVREGGYRSQRFGSRLVAYDAKAERLVETGVGAGTWLTLEYRVTNLANVPPVLGKLPPQVAYPGDTFVLSPAGRDADNDRLTYAITPVPAGARVSTDGVLVWTPSFDDLGKHAFAVSVTDGKKAVSGSAEVTVVEPLSGGLLPRGAIAKLGGTTALSVREDTHWDNGSAGGGLGETAVSVTCAYAGDNPTNVSVTCNVTGRIRGGNTPGPFAFGATARVAGNGLAYLSATNGESGRLQVALRRGASGATELVVTGFFYSKRVTFGMRSWPGSDVLTQIGGSGVVAIAPMP